MAIMVPFEPVETDSLGEKKIFETLKNKLSDEWLVAHSFRWLKNKPEKSKKYQGEGDFVIFNPNYGCMVIEVKGGGIIYKDRLWFSVDLYNNEHRIKDPEKQASDTKFQIIDRFKEKNISCNVFHLVWFPDIDEIKGDELPAALNEKIVLIKDSLVNPEKSLIDAFEYWYQITGFKRIQLSYADEQSVKNVLCKKLVKIQSLSRICEDINQSYNLATNEQIELLESLNNLKTLSIQGRAGTGKTVLAVEKAKFDSLTCENVLLLCFNSELAKLIRNNLTEYQNIYVHTMHSLALNYLKKHHPSRVLHIQYDEEFEYILTEFKEVVAYNSKENFDSVIIDEGQDFKPEWVKTIKYLLKPSSNFYIFYDPYQELYSNNDKFDDSYLVINGPFILQKNMRNTDEISRCLFNILEEPYTDSNFKGIHGKHPYFILSNSDDECLVHLKQTIYELTHVQLVGSDKITVITLQSLYSSMAKNDPVGVEFTTARKFKGLENDIVIIIDADLSYLIDPVKKRLLYVAMSRARAHAIVIINSNDKYKKYLFEKWNCSDDNLIDTISHLIIKGEDKWNTEK